MCTRARDYLEKVKRNLEEHGFSVLGEGEKKNGHIHLHFCEVATGLEATLSISSTPRDVNGYRYAASTARRAVQQTHDHSK